MKGAIASVENSFATILTVAVVVLPLAEVALRAAFATIIPGAGPFTLHLTLWIGMLGAAIAAREGKLLILATGTLFPEGPLRRISQIAGAGAGVLVTTILSVAGWQLVQ